MSFYHKEHNPGKHLLEALGIIFFVLSMYTLLVDLPNYYAMFAPLEAEWLAANIQQPYERMLGDMNVSLVVLAFLAAGYFALGFLTIVFKNDLDKAKAMLIVALIFTAFVILMRIANIEGRTLIWAEGELRRHPFVVPFLACVAFIVATAWNHKIHKKLQEAD